MDNAAAMRLVQGIGDFDSVPQHVLDWQWALLEALRERLTFHAFHHQE